MSSVHWLSSMVRVVVKVSGVIAAHPSLDLHPLAVEDLLHVRQGARSKADYYPKHLFLRILRHCLTTDEDASTGGSVTHLPRSSSPLPYDDDDSYYEDSTGKVDDDQTAYGSLPTSRFTTKRSSTLTNAVKRRLSKDVEAPASATQTPRLGNVASPRPSVSAL